jgi:hypothetical protein
MTDETRADTCERYRRLARQNRKTAAELLQLGKADQATRDAVSGLLRDARDNDAIADSFADTNMH